MTLKTEKRGTIYHSVFDEKTGAIVRTVEELDRYKSIGENDKAFQKRYPQRWFRSRVFSPVPETVDIAITDKCSMHCSYCYMDSKPRDAHAPKELVETILRGFDEPPFQVALGGGDPTQHPDFTHILRTVREIGTVPNYTTAGHAMTEKIIQVTNEVCGGVAMTFHAFKGIDWFVERYTRLRDRLKVQLNVHLIADRDVATNLNLLTSLREKIGPLNLVLLAFYPNVGRSNTSGLMPKQVYMTELPKAIDAAQKVGTKIAFSEALLPYFLSRPELGIETKYAMPSEGCFSCYFDTAGRISDSSFNPPRDKTPTVWAMKEGGFGSQKMWDELDSRKHTPNGVPCYGCPKEGQCSAPHATHMLVCAWQPHNQKNVESPGSTGVRGILNVLKGD